MSAVSLQVGPVTTRRDWVTGLEAGHAGLIELAARTQALATGAAPKRCEGKRLAAVFLAPSLRTRMSLAAACHELGVEMMSVAPGSSGWALELEPGAVMQGDKAEHIQDAMAVMAQYADVIAVRAFQSLTDHDANQRDAVLAACCQYANSPILSLESARFHPLQGLADLATWQRHLGSDLRGKKLCLTWAPHPKALPAAVPNQVLLMAAMAGMQTSLVHPEEFDLDPALIKFTQQLAKTHGGDLAVQHEQVPALQDADVIYMKSWGGFSLLGEEQKAQKLRRQYADWQIDSQKIAQAPNAGLMHCMPVRRNVVASDAVLDSPQCWMQEQAGLRLWSAVAVLEQLLQTERGTSWKE